MRKKVEMTKEEVLVLGNGLTSLTGLKGTDFNFKLLRTQKELAKAVKDINKVRSLVDGSKGMIDYNKARTELCEKVCVRNEDLSPKLIMNQGQETYDIPDTKEVKDQFETLSKDHSVALKEREENIKLYNSMLNDKVSVELHMIDELKLPEDLTGAQISVLKDLIIEEE